MHVTFSHCAGLDVHKKSIVACTLTPSGSGAVQRQTRTFGTMTADLLALADWLTQQEVTHVVLESTGEFWKPVYNLLEPLLTVWVVNAHHVKAVPGRKTDVKDAEWLADLLRHGLVRPSFIPPQPQRDLRDLTRQRTCLIQDRATVVNRLHKVLEWANIKLTSVVSDVTGTSARAMLDALLAGEQDTTVLAALGQGRLRAQPELLAQALAGRVRDHHCFLLAQHLAQVDFLDEQIARFTQQIEQALDPPPLAPAPPPAAPAEPEGMAPPAAPPPLDNRTARAILDTAPGVGRAVAEVILAEVGTDMGRFASAAHLTSWAKLAPGNDVSAGKRRSGHTGQGSRWLRTALVQAAHAAVRRRGGYLGAVYRRLVVRLGAKRAIIAIARRLLTAIYYMLLRHEPYQERGAAAYDSQQQQRRVHRLRHQLESCGYRVSLEPLSVPA
jgi:transposase